MSDFKGRRFPTDIILVFVRWYQRYTDASWRVDETYVKVAGQWAYLYRAIDKNR
jgi:putative transposase